MNKELLNEIEESLLNEVNVENEIELEVVELEDKIVPRNWDIYALVYA